MTQDPSEWTTGRLLMTASRLVQHAWEELLRTHGVSHAGFVILECLLDGSMPQRALARDCRVTDQTISRSIERLERHGLVTRATDPYDERRQLVSVTQEGRALHGRIRRQVESSSLISESLTDPQEFRAALMRLIAALDGVYT